jgi:hypothetical protein
MELVKIIIYFKNRFSIKSLLDTTPWELFYREKSDFSNLRIIESLVYYYNVETETGPNRRIKSDPRNRQIRLIRYSKRFSQYRIWNSINNKIEKITFIRINESDYMIILKELREQEIILFLFNESENSSSNNKMIEISIPLINFNKDKYESFSIFIH